MVEIANARDMARAFRIRRRVFIEEQGVPEEIELDDADATAVHVLAIDRTIAVGCARMIAHGGWVKIGRMAVMPKWRGRGIGRAMLEWLTARAAASGARIAVLHAQVHAEKFYRGCGFKAVGDIFEEAGIAHRRMERALVPKRILTRVRDVSGNRKSPRPRALAARESRDGARRESP